MNRARPALIIVDMQKGMANPALPRNNREAERNIEQLLKAWRGAWEAAER
jgi:nicotinamidase-related amidase